MEKIAYKGRVADAIMQILPRSREYGLQKTRRCLCGAHRMPKTIEPVVGYTVIISSTDDIMCYPCRLKR